MTESNRTDATSATSVAVKKLVEQDARLDGMQTQIDENTEDIVNLSNTVNDGHLTKNSITTRSITGQIADFSTSLHATNAEVDSLETTNADVADLSVTDVLDVHGTANIDNAVVNTEQVNILSATTANIDTANIKNANFENISGTNSTWETVNTDNVNVTNKVEAATLEGVDVNATNVNADKVTATSKVVTDKVEAEDVETTKAHVDEAFVDVLDNRYKRFRDFYQDIRGLTETGYFIIELPQFTAGEYRLSYESPVTGEVYFTMIVSNTYDNASFSYYRKPDNPLVLQEVAIKDMKLYIKTGVEGRLYYFSDTLASIEPPHSSDDWPIDLTQLDYPLYEATRARATVYTNYVNIGMNEGSLGTAVFSLATTQNWDNVENQRLNNNPVEYDPNNDRTALTYIPNQDVNSTADVDFNSVDSNTGVATETLTMKSIQDDTYLIKRDGSTEMTEEQPADSLTDNSTLDRASKKLITERDVAQWNGSTSRVTDLTDPSNPVYTSSIKKLNVVDEGEWNAGDVTAPDINATNDLHVAGDAYITGDLTVSGKTITVHSEEITTEENTIELRHDAQVGLNPGEVSGVLINNYDGQGNDSEIVLDDTGTLRIGDTASLEPVATRDEAANFTDGHLTTWDATNKRLVDAGASISDILSAGTSTIEGWSSITSLLGTPTDLADLVSKAQTYMQANNFSEMRLTAYTTAAQAASYISLTWTANSVFDLQVTATNGFKARFFDNTHFGIYNNNNWDVNIINDVIVKDSSGELTVTSNEVQSNTNLQVEATGDITMAPTNAFVIPTKAPKTLTPGAIWIA